MSCYTLHGGRIQPNFEVDAPCGVTNSTHPHVPCCVKGDYCMSNGICHFINQKGGRGYYAADCTDPTLQDPACMTRCGGHYLSDLTYDETTGLWACCSYNSDGKPNCSSATDEKFPAPAPTKLTTLQYLPPIDTPTYLTATATATVDPTSSDVNPSSSSNNKSQLGVGAAAGIGVGVGAGVFLAAMAGLFIYLRRQRLPKYQHDTLGSSMGAASQPGWIQSGPQAQQQQVQRRQELGNRDSHVPELA
ncbi:hypothetical protein BDV29DRAFT_178832 [Aspergillus leporis]|uniref:Mid2 domain-containing protein n=1 Tax=Aspergillus leporis TaxID=41062 RepID=A0A5N5WV22_9EURO|nr:hypothetical protein BDV29DRAFT_178832 [Aspergillus leporis]